MAELKRKAKILPPKFNMMAKIKFDPNKGLGKHSQGRKNPIKAIRVPYKANLGFKPLLKHQFKNKKKKKVGHKATQHLVSTSALSKTCNTLPTKPSAQIVPFKPNTEHSSIEQITIPPSVINQHPTYHLEATLHTLISSTKPSIPEIGECSTPNTS